LHPGQLSGGASSLTARAARVPQCGQKSIPANIVPKHDGQATVVRIEPQYSQLDALRLGAGAPQVGQLKEAGISG
jgi:hypothetical protein